MDETRSDTYWTRIKWLLGASAGLFALYFVLAMVRGAPEDITFQQYPLLTLLLSATALTWVVTVPVGIYYISKDKHELAKDYPDVSERHWVTVAVFSYFSAGIYPLYYLWSRRKKTQTEPPTDVDPDEVPEPVSATDSVSSADSDSSSVVETAESISSAVSDSLGDSGQDEEPGASQGSTVDSGATGSPAAPASPAGEADAGDGGASAVADRVQSVSAGPATEAGPPDQIPRAPKVDIAYEDLDIGEALGSGGNAEVSRATLPDGSVLAVKSPRLSGTIHAETVDRMLDEAETWDKLDDHDHVVGVVDYGSQPMPWIAMEYMDGGHLGERAGDLPTEQALWTAISVTKAVRHAHRRGVAHLDLKPENLLFREVEDAWDVPKVADWGLSKHLLEHSMTVDGLSPQYAAPEQFDGERGPADDITDVYQLGAVFYELFTGRPPFEGPAASVMHATLNDEPTPPSAVADVPEDLDDVLGTALATEREDRYESVLLLRNALQDVARGL